MAGDSEESANTAVSAALSLIGVMLGISVYFHQESSEGRSLVWGCIGLSLLLIIALNLGRWRMRKHPVQGRWLIEAWAIAPILAGAWSTVLIIWFLLRFPAESFVDAFHLDEDAAKEVREILIGAITALVAAGVTKEFTKEDGALRVSSRFRSALTSVTRDIGDSSGGTSTPYDAVNSVSVPGHGKIGWGFAARGVRASIIQDYRKAHPARP